MSVFETLSKINVNEHTEQKNGLTYLSWAWAWAEVKKAFPDANYTVYENKDGLIYHTDGKTCWVKTGVAIEGIEHIEYLPVMDFKNRSIAADAVTSFDVNKAIQRSLTKAVARHGLGLYIYAGEDLPDEESQDRKAQVINAKEEARERDTAGLRILIEGLKCNCDWDSIDPVWLASMYKKCSIDELNANEVKNAVGNWDKVVSKYREKVGR